MKKYKINNIFNEESTTLNDLISILISSFLEKELSNDIILNKDILKL